MNNLMSTRIPWLPFIPSDWKIAKVKQCFRISKELSYKKNPTILSLARSSVKIRDISSNEGQLAANYSNYNSVKPGDLLLNPMDLYSGANCNVSNLEGVISPAYSNLRAKTQLEPKFYDFYFKTQYWTMAMFAHGKGVSYDNRWTLNADTLLNYEIPVPSFNEQTKIVDFLNKQTSKINQLISNQEKQIEKLKEYRQAIITKAVTKGLDPNVPMKDSGVEWIGKIPCNWEILRLKYCFSVRNEKYENGNYDYVALENVESFSGKYIATESNAFYSLAETIRANRNDVIFGKLRPYLSKAFLIAKDCYVSSEFAVLYGLGGNRTSFLKYLLISSKFINVINSSTYGTKMPRANIDFIRNLGIAIPDVKTQKEIVNYLDETCSKIDWLIDVKVKNCAQLSNYKKALVYEYVTGKKRVSL